MSVVTGAVVIALSLAGVVRSQPAAAATTATHRYSTQMVIVPIGSAALMTITDHQEQKL
jgi:hypothetical protein